MTNATAQSTTSTAVLSWQEANQYDLGLELQRLRLLIQRRVLWLRTQWKHDPLQNYNYQGLIISESQADHLLSGEDRHAEAQFYAENPEAVTITRSMAQLEQVLDAQRQAWNEAQAAPALDTLVRLFGLNDFERATLLLCLAPELDPAFERLYAYIQDDVRCKYATPHLALTLFAQQPYLTPSQSAGSNVAIPSPTSEGQGWGERLHNSLSSAPEAPRLSQWDARNSFLPQAPLRRFRLLNLEPSPTPATTLMAHPLRLDERMVDYLRGVNRLDERVADLLRPLAPALLAPPHQDLVDRLVRSEDWRASGEAWTPLNLVGVCGAGKRALARALCDHMGLGIYMLDVRRLPEFSAERQEVLRLLDRDLVLLQAALYLEAPEIGRASTAALDAMNDGLERLRVFFILGSHDRWTAERLMLVVPVPKPDATTQRVLWANALVGVPHSLNGQIDALVEQFDLGPAAIAEAIAAARHQALFGGGQEGTELSAIDLWQACRDLARRQLDDLAQRITPCYTWTDIVLPEDIFRQLQEIAAQVAHRYQVFEAWGFGARLSRGRGLSALFAGASGTGKTMAAEILAHHLQLDLYRIDLAGVVSKYIGETEKNLRKVFDAAEQSGAILFFDEADALFGKRSEVKDSHDRYANIEVNYLLQRMEDYHGLAILATNRKSALDRAFLRRLRFLVDFPAPDVPSRRAIWQKVFPPAAAQEHLDFDALARLELPGGNIKNIALNGAFLAAGDQAPICMTHLMRAARREYAKIDKLITPTEFGRYYEMVRS
jgi:hypothetical protein